LRLATQRLLDIMALPAPARLAKTLLRLAELQCPAPRDGMWPALRLSQSELGGMTGLTRESINKQLASLRDAGWISLSGGSVTLLDVAALEDFINGDERQRSRQAEIFRGRNEYVRAMPRSSGPFSMQPAANRTEHPSRADLCQARP
jgi:hypothetical protein